MTGRGKAAVICGVVLAVAVARLDREVHAPEQRAVVPPERRAPPRPAPLAPVTAGDADASLDERALRLAVQLRELGDRPRRELSGQPPPRVALRDDQLRLPRAVADELVPPASETAPRTHD